MALGETGDHPAKTVMKYCARAHAAIGHVKIPQTFHVLAACLCEPRRRSCLISSQNPVSASYTCAAWMRVINDGVRRRLRTIGNLAFCDANRMTYAQKRSAT